MALVLDTGALTAFDQGDRRVAALVEAARRRRLRVVTSAGCVAQSWRDGGSRQALLARLLRGTDEEALDGRVSRAVGDLCAITATSDVVDAHVSLLAHDRDVVVTSDGEDIERLLRARRCQAETVRC